MRIKVDKKKCSGCHMCEMVCSLFHLGTVNTEKSAIRIQKDDLNTSLNRPFVCRQCKEMKCLDGEDAMEGAEEKLKAYIRNVAETLERNPYLPRIMMREFASGDVISRKSWQRTWQIFWASFWECLKKVWKRMSSLKQIFLLYR